MWRKIIILTLLIALFLGSDIHSRIYSQEDSRFLPELETITQDNIWELEQLALLTIDGNVTDVDVAFNEEGYKLAAGSDIGITYLWKFGTHDIEQVVLEPTRVTMDTEVRDVELISSGSSVFSLLAETELSFNVVERWSASTGSRDYPMRIPVAHTFDIAPNGSRIVTGLDDGRVCLWNTLTGETIKCLDQFQYSQLLPTVEFSPTEPVVAIANGSGLWLWDIDSFEIIGEINYPANLVTFSNNGNRLAYQTLDGEIHVADLSEMSFSETLEPNLVIETPFIDSLAFSANDSMLLTSSRDENDVWLRVYDSDTGEQLIDILLADTENGLQKTRLAISPDGNLIFIQYRDAEIEIWGIPRESTP